MIDDKKTLGELLSDPRIGKIAADAIRNRDLSREEVWNKTPAQLKDEHFFFGDIGRGFRRLFAAADTGDWYYPLYSEAECAEDAARRNVNMVWFPSNDPQADERPFILLVPGGGFVNVWNLTEGWPVAAQFNSEGYHVFILTYQIDGEERLLEKELGDMARALRLIREKEKHFRLQADRYITCGFSAGGMLVCLWNTEMGYPAFHLAKPQASFPIYPFVSLKLAAGDAPEEDTQEETEEDEREDIRLYGCPFTEAMEKPFESPEHAEGFPPCAIFVMAGDELLGHSKLLADSLEKLHIPCRLEIGPEGGHGFADGTGTCIAGWIERAVRWYEEWNGINDAPVTNPCQAVSVDAAAVAALACELWPDHPLEEMTEEFESLLAREDAAVFVYREQGETVGFAQCQLRHDYVEGTETSPVGYLEGIYVREGARRQGVARKLLSACESWAKEHGCKEFASDCELDNTDSQRFHRAVGFEEANRIVAYVKKL